MRNIRRYDADSDGTIDRHPLLYDPRGPIIPEVFNPYMAAEKVSFDLTPGYRRRIRGRKDWSAQLNLRTLQNISGDAVTAIRHQPDGTVARVRYDPTFQVLRTNTVRF